MTERGDPRALFQPTYACNLDNDSLQVELRFVGKQNAPPGGWICVRPSFDNSHEFRYYPPENTSKFLPVQLPFCLGDSVTWLIDQPTMNDRVRSEPILHQSDTGRRPHVNRDIVKIIGEDGNIYPVGSHQLMMRKAG